MARWRLAAHLQRQDWAAVLIDLAIVVIGVFLGIQASNWNDERHDQRVANAYLQRIDSDLRSDVRQLRLHEDYWRASAEAGDRALHFAEEGRRSDDEWNTLLDFFHAGEVWSFTESNGTYNEMLSAGRLDLFSDSRLKAQLGNYYIGRRTQHLLFDAAPAYRDDIRAAVPYRFQRYILDHCEASAYEANKGIPCPAPADAAGLRGLNRSLARNAKLIGELRNWMTTLHYTRGVGTDDQRTARRLINEIAADRH